MKPSGDSTEFARWEEFSIRLGVFGAKRAQLAGKYDEAANTLSRVLTAVDRPKCTTRIECRRLALAYGQLAWSALLAGDYDLGIKSSTEAIAIVNTNHLPNMSFVELNRAHALMFTGAREQAIALYQKFPPAEVTEDFRVLRKAGRCDGLMVQVDPTLSCDDRGAAN
jgi:hypothetical protein